MSQDRVIACRVDRTFEGKLQRLQNEMNFPSQSATLKYLLSLGVERHEDVNVTAVRSAQEAYKDWAVKRFVTVMRHTTQKMREQFELFDVEET